MVCLKSPRRTSYLNRRETVALNCLVFEKKIAFLYAFWRQTDIQTNGRTDGQRRSIKALSLSRVAP